MALLRSITQAIGSIWARGCLGKAAVIFGTLVLFGMCSSALGLGGRAGPTSPQPTSAAAALVATSAPSPEPPPEATVAPAPTEAPEPTATARPTLAPLPTPLGARSTNGTDCPADHPVKGNIRDREPNKGEKIYHVPESPSYADTKPERCFVDAAQAEQAGYRAPR